MLCRGCRRRLSRGAAVCDSCGEPLPGAEAPLELVLAGGERVPLVGDILIGRAAGCTLQLADPSVSRRHARISADNGAPARIEDAGSSHGTYLDGRRLTGPTALHDGVRIELGDQELVVERRRSESEAGRTIVVRPGASLVVPALGAPAQASATEFGLRPRVRSGYALKRLEADEGRRRWVLRDLQRDDFLRLSDNDAQLLALLDGSRDLRDLIAEAEARFGAAGPARLARLLADLGERGLLAGVEGRDAGEAPKPLWRRIIGPHEKTWAGADRIFGWVYPHGGWLLFTRPALWLGGAVAIGGLLAFLALIVLAYGTPFVVRDRLLLGGAVFLAGRFLVVALHELAHGLAMASVGRRVPRAGLKFFAVLPYAFVDTSEAWFEPRRRRMAISAAGPATDLALGGFFALCSLALAQSNTGDVFFQLAFAGYVGALFNLNPFLERDGYHILVDHLGEPGLRRRAREQFKRRLAGRGDASDSPVLERYSRWGLVWGFALPVIVIGVSLRYIPIFTGLISPDGVVYAVVGTLWAASFVPVLIVLVPPLVERIRGRD
jgi:putative peptide zinc metalloprotease protein